MPRPEGSKNEDYEVKRNKILESLFQKLVQKNSENFLVLEMLRSY